MYGSGSGMSGMKPPKRKYPHPMYHKTKKPMMVMAKTPAEHARLEKAGYDHTKPKSMK